MEVSESVVEKVQRVAFKMFRLKYQRTDSYYFEIIYPQTRKKIPAIT